MRDNYTDIHNNESSVFTDNDDHVPGAVLSASTHRPLKSPVDTNGSTVLIFKMMKLKHSKFRQFAKNSQLVGGIATSSQSARCQSLQA